MSWDVIVLNVSDDIETVSELTDESVTPLGSRDQVFSVIARVFPQANLSDPTWVVLDGEGYSIEFSLGQNDQIDTLMLYVRGSSKAIDAIERFCNESGWRAFDSAAGDFIDFSSHDRDRGLKLWQQYRDSIIDDRHEA